MHSLSNCRPRWACFAVKFVADKLLIVTGWPRAVQGVHRSLGGVGAGTSPVVELLTVAAGVAGRGMLLEEELWIGQNPSAHCPPW